MTKQPFHPDMIAEQRRLLQQRLRKRRRISWAIWKNSLHLPPPGRNFFERAVQHAETIYNFVDGAMVGYKLIRSFNFVFKRSKQKKTKRLIDSDQTRLE